MPIERKQIATDEAIQAPLLIADNFEVLLGTIEKMLGVVRAGSVELQKLSSPSKLTDGISQLTEQEKQLIAIQGQLSKALAKNNDEYVDYKKGVDAVNQAVKEKISLDGKDAKQVDAQTSSLNQLGAALKANRQAYGQLKTEADRNSKSGEELLAVIVKQKKEFDELNKKVGKGEIVVKGFETSMTGLKAEFKAASNEMVRLAKELGTDSKEFQQAAQKAGELKNEVGDLQKAISNVSGSKIENLSSTFGDVFGKLKSGNFSGALDSARQFATISKSITFAEAGKSLKEFGTTLSVLGKAIFTNPLFLIPALLAGVIILLVRLRDDIPFVSSAFKAVGDAVEYTTGKIKEFTDWIGLTTFAINEKRKATEEAASKELDAVKKRYDREIKISESANKEVLDLEQQKWMDVIEQATIGLNSLVQANNTFRKEDLEKVNKYYDEIANANTELSVVLIKQEEQRLLKLADLRAKERANRKGDRKISTDETIEYNLAEYNLGLELQKKTADINEKFRKQELESYQRASEIKDKLDIESAKKKNILVQEAFQFTLSVNAAILDNYTMQYEQLTTMSKEARDYELKLVGDNKEAQEAINKRFDADDKKLKNEQAQRQKKIALLSIALSTAQGIVAALATLNIPLSISIGVVGALQLATAAGLKLPGFKKGTKNAPGGLALVGEDGVEKVETPSGKTWLTPDGPTLAYVEKGSKVFTANSQETADAIALESIANNGGRQVTKRESDGVEKELRAINKNLRNQKQLHFNVSKRGAELMMVEAQTRTRLLSTLYA